MLKGDTTWATRKVVLGWVLDMCAMTMQLPPHRVTRLFELLDSFTPKQPRTTVNKWQKLLGELRSMVLGIPGGKGLFGVLQEALWTKFDHGTRVTLSSAVHHILADFRWMVQDLTRRPTCISEIIPKTKPDMMRAQDAAATGMGGAHFVPQLDGTVQPMLWRCPFPYDVQQRLISYDNPQGGINNSELELSASVAQPDVLAQAFNVREETVHNSSDNVSSSLHCRRYLCANARECGCWSGVCKRNADNMLSTTAPAISINLSSGGWRLQRLLKTGDCM
jgi:hypothetical protein